MAEGPTKRWKQSAGQEMPIPRIPGQKPACQWCPKIPPGAAPVPESAEELSEKNWEAYTHHQKCSEIGTFGEAGADEIVRQNAMLIGRMTREAKAVHDLRAQMLAIQSLPRKPQ